MSWEPTTRGTSPTKQICHWGDCQENNEELSHYTVDVRGIRYFCQEHWDWTNEFVELVKHCEKCVRNHNADLYKDARSITDIKHLDKWWAICHYHFDYYDRKLCNFLDGLDYTED